MSQTTKMITDKAKLDEIIAIHQDKPGKLLGILEDAQKLNPHKYLSRDVLEYIADKLNLPVSKIYNVITFYAFFNLKPQGKHSIIVCRGTACHTRRSKNLLDYLINWFGFKDSDLEAQEKASLTTKDNQFTIKTVACFGQCALAPVVEVDGNIYSHMTEDKLRKIIKGVLSKKSK
jgi:NADH-quinone oxidoreductase subunit E